MIFLQLKLEGWNKLAGKQVVEFMTFYIKLFLSLIGFLFLEKPKQFCIKNISNPHALFAVFFNYVPILEIFIYLPLPNMQEQFSRCVSSHTEKAL